MKTRILRKNAGFTLVELMVVVAIIGVLTSVAIPNFRRYQAKSKTSEAKLNLAGIYTAMITLQSDYDHFAPCLTDAGFSQQDNTYYSVGFAADAPAPRTDVINNGGACGASQFSYAADREVGGTKTTASELAETFTAGFGVDNASTFTTPTIDADGENFVAGAIGYIDSNFNDNRDEASYWLVNDAKEFRESNKGY